MAARGLALEGVSRRALSACALLTALALPRPALSQASVADAGAAPERQALAEAAFSQAMEAWRRTDCIGAAEGFERAMALVPHPQTRYNLARALACAHGEPRAIQRAIEQYRLFLAETDSADDRADVEQRIAVLQRSPAEVVITSEPLRASVTVVGEAMSPHTTPWRLQLTAGNHTLLFEHPGYQPAVRPVVVEAGTNQDVHVALVALATQPPPRVVTPPPPDRILARRTARPLSGRLGLITGFAVPRDLPVFLVGAEAAVFYRRSLSAQAHLMWIDTVGAPFVVGGDIGWVFVLDEVDLGLYVSGSALFSCDTSCRDGTLRRDTEQFVGGFALRADVVLHPRIAVGLFGRTAWRNFDLSNSEGLLASGGLSLSLSL